MKVSGASSVALTEKSAQSPVSTTPGSSFSEVLQNLPGAKGYDTILELEQKIRGASELSGKDLISYQITVSRFGLEVELTSKIAEGGLSALRRLQSNQ